MKSFFHFWELILTSCRKNRTLIPLAWFSNIRSLLVRTRSSIKWLFIRSIDSYSPGIIDFWMACGHRYWKQALKMNPIGITVTSAARKGPRKISEENTWQDFQRKKFWRSVLWGFKWADYVSVYPEEKLRRKVKYFKHFYDYSYLIYFLTVRSHWNIDVSTITDLHIK